MNSETILQVVSYVIVLGVPAAVVALYLLAWSRSTYRFAQYPFFLIHLFWSVFVWRTRVNRRINLPRGQGAIIIGNHRSSIDPSFIHVASDRVVHWMIASEYWKSPMMGGFFRLAECIPVNRGGVDTAATKMAIRYAQNGGFVGMFPEGRINTTDELLLPGRPGVALVALKARVPVIPCFIHGAPYDGTTLGVFTMPGKVRVVVGEPIDLSPYYGREREDGVLQELTLLFMKEMAKLAGQPEFEPKLAGRRWKTFDGAEPEILQLPPRPERTDERMNG